MAETRTPILCGGTFFTLVLRALQDHTSARNKILENSDGLSQPEVLMGLMLVEDPSHKIPNTKQKGVMSSLSTIASNFKACNNINSTYFPFFDDDISEAFDNRVKENHDAALKDMIKFVDAFINKEIKGVKLVSALAELIAKDPTITDDTELYIRVDNTPVRKADMFNESQLNLYAFLLGTWHFIIMNRPDNRVGIATYKSWHNTDRVELNAQKPFESDLWKNSKLKVNVDTDKPKLASEVQTSNNVILGTVGTMKLSDFDPADVAKGKAYIEKVLGNEEDVSGIKTYLKKAYDKYSTLKTLMYRDEPKPFYSFYVCNNVTQRIYISRSTWRVKTYENATEDSLSECSNFIIISGTGGLGKSMMMRHLLLNSISNYKAGHRIPIFIQLKDFSEKYESLAAFIYEKFGDLGARVDFQKFTELLAQGKCLLLFDGLDEINSEVRKQFEQSLERFADRYTDNMFIISSRPSFGLSSFSRFTVLELQPFSKQQSLELVDKLEFRPDEPSIKENFRKQLDEKLWNTHQQFAENPLLLTIMLMTFEEFAEVPSKMHIFYHEAYVTLSQRHDAMKAAFKRTIRMGISADRFADYFAEFCARTYCDQKYELSEIEFDKYFNELSEKQKDLCKKTTEDFIYDLTNNMCLMFYESQKYHFIHRSFQEYFCAVYFSKQKDKNLKRIGDMFENRRMNYSDKTFDMLYDMIPERVEEYIFRPYLEELFKKCDEEDGYWTFLKELYPTIYYDNGEVDDSSDNEPNSYIYDFIISEKHIHGYAELANFPFCEEFVSREYVYLDEDWNDPEGVYSGGLIDKEDVSLDYIYEYGDPDTVGWNLEFDVDRVLDEPEKYGEFIKILYSDDFPLKEEYVQVRDYLEEMKEEQDPEGTNLFDFLG